MQSTASLASMSSGADSSTPRIANVSKGQLEYQTSVSGQWLPLQSYDNEREPLSTIHTVIFREGNISFVQQTCGGAVSCGVKLLPVNYGSRIKIGTTESGPSMPFDIILELTREEACLTSCLRSADAGIEPKHSLRRCPLARVCKSFTAMRLYLPRDNFEPQLKRSSGPNDFWFKIVNALRRDLNSVLRPIPDGASVAELSIGLSSSPNKILPPSVSKVNTTPVQQRFNDLLASKKNSSPPKKSSTSGQQVATYSEPRHTQGQENPTQQSKVQKPFVQKPPTTPQRQPGPPKPKQPSSPAGKSVQKPPTTSQKQPVASIPKQASSSMQPPPTKPKQTLSFVQPSPPTLKQTSTFVQPTPPKAEATSAFVQPVPPKSKQTSSIVQPNPPKSKQISEFAQSPSMSKQASAFVQPTPPNSKQTSSHQAKSVQKPPTTPQRQPVSPNPEKASAFVQPAPPKSRQTSEFAQSQGFLIPKTVNQKPLAKPAPINPPPRKIVDYKDLDSVVAVPSGLTNLDYGNPSIPKQKGSAKEPERPKWEASIIQLQKLKEAAELEGDKAMAEKARKMIKIFEADAASPGKETKAKVDNFKTMWTLM